MAGSLYAADPATNSTPIISGPVVDAISFAATEGATNWMFGIYGINSFTSHQWGGGIGAGYKLSSFVMPVMRLDYIGGEVWMPSGNLQLQVPLMLFGKVEAIPLTFAGVATTVAGGGSENGAAVGILGIGMAVKVASWVDLIADYELWNGGPFHQDNQIRFAAAFKFW